MAERPAGRRTFGPVVVAGLAGAGLAAMAGHEAWVTGGSCPTSSAAGVGYAESAATTAVALALLAAWGVLLVTRGRFRRALAVLTLVLALGLVATVLLDGMGAPDALRQRFLDLGLHCTDVHRTGWFWTAVAALPLAVLPALAALRFVATWPEMGRRYDAPVDQAPPPKPPEEQENLDLWKAMDEGRDPTA